MWYEQVRDAARALSGRGAAKGGNARAASLPASERSEIAKRAVRKRWAKAGKGEIGVEAEGDLLGEFARPIIGPAEKPYSMFRGTLAIGEVGLQCHVLNDGRRVLTQREVVRALGILARARGGCQT
jgi:hypothetical protein